MSYTTDTSNFDFFFSSALLCMMMLEAGLSVLPPLLVKWYLES